MQQLDASRFVLLDETGSNTAMDRRYGRAPRGQRVDGPVPHGHYKNVTLTAAIRLEGVGGYLAFDGATDGAMFEHYVERSLVPTLRAGDIVIMDNLSAQKGPEIERLIRGAGAEVCYLPAYSRTSTRSRRCSPNSRRTCVAWPLALWGGSTRPWVMPCGR